MEAAPASPSPLGLQLLTGRISFIQPGESLGRYTVLELIGRGGMGEVFKAYDPELDRVIALKVLRPELVEQSAQARARFAREAQAMGRLNHPNVVSVYDVGAGADRVFVAMELVSGPNLSAWLAQHRNAPPREIVELFLQAGRGLAAAHDAGIVHRDFKPSNVIVGDRVRVADFGLARLIQEPLPDEASHQRFEVSSKANDNAHEASDNATTAPTRATDKLANAVTDASDAVAHSDPGAGHHDGGITQTGHLVGTPAYMAPEQRAGATPTALSDQYSFGVALHEGVFGVRPDAATPATRRKVPSWLAAVVDRALQVRPADRYPSMRHLLAALGRDPWRARRRAAWVVGAAVVIGSLVVAARDATPRCESAEPQVAGLWAPPAQARVAAAFRATGLPYAEDTFSKVDRGLRQWQAAWAREHRNACEATHVRHEQSDARLDRRMRCLSRAKADVAALVTELGHADGRALDRATQATGDLGATDVCADASLLSATEPPRNPVVRGEVEALREGLSRLAAQRKLGQWREGLALGETLVEHARRVAHDPMLAQVLVAVASLNLTADGDVDGAIERSYEAALLGSATQDDNVVASAFDNLLYALGSKKQKFDAAEVAYRAAQAAIARLGNPPRYVAELKLYRSYALYRKGDFAGALALRRELVLLQTEIYGPDSYQVASTLGQIAGAMTRLGRAVEARPIFERSLAIAERAIGPLHPNLGVMLQNAGGSVRETGDIDAAARFLERAVEVEEARMARDNPAHAHAIESLAAVRYEQRRLGDARALLERAIQMRLAKLGPEAPELASSYAILAAVELLEGRPAEAYRLFQQCIAIEHKAFGEVHPQLGGSYRETAGALIALGRWDEAQKAIDRALAIDKQTIGEDHPDHGDTLRALGDLRCAAHSCRGAAELYQRAVALHEKEVGADSPVLVDPLTGQCAALLATGAAAAARAVAERAVWLAQHASGDQLGAAELCLARSAWETGARDEARRLARAARTRLAALSFPAPALPAVERWLSAHP